VAPFGKNCGSRLSAQLKRRSASPLAAVPAGALRVATMLLPLALMPLMA